MKFFQLVIIWSQHSHRFLQNDAGLAALDYGHPWIYGPAAVPFITSPCSSASCLGDRSHVRKVKRLSQSYFIKSQKTVMQLVFVYEVYSSRENERSINNVSSSNQVTRTICAIVIDPITQCTRQEIKRKRNLSAAFRKYAKQCANFTTRSKPLEPLSRARGSQCWPMLRN